MITIRRILGNINKSIIVFWPYILVLACIALPWFLKPGYLFFTDMVWGPNINLDWRQLAFLFNLIIKALSFIFPVAFLEKIFIIIILALILFGGRRFVLAVSKIGDTSISRGLTFILSLFALFNPFVYDRALYGQFGVLMAYGCLFFVAAYLLTSFKTLDFSHLKYAALFSAIALMFSIHFIFLLFPFYLLFFVGLLIKQKGKKMPFFDIRFWQALLFSVLIIFIINANWLFVIVFQSSPLTRVEQNITQQDLSAFQTVGNVPSQALGNVLLMSGFWGKEQFRYFDLTNVSGWQKSFLFLSPIILYGIWLSFWKRNRRDQLLSTGLLIIFIVVIVLALGVKAGFASGLSMFLYDHLPMYKGLRESQKWVAVIIPIYLFYLTLGAIKLKQTKVITHNLGLSGTVLVAIIIMQAPSLLFGFNGQAQPIAYPVDWVEVNKFLLNNSASSYSCHDKTIFLPWHMYMSFRFAGRIIVNPAPAFFPCPTITGTNMEYGGIYDNSADPDGAVINAWLVEQGQGGMPVISGKQARYVMLAEEVDFLKYGWLDNLPYLKLVKDTPSLKLYEITY